MSVSTFLKLVEIQTKLASLFPFLLGMLFSLYYFRAFNPVNTLVFFVAMTLFDMTATAINNLMDYRKAKNEDYRNDVNIIGQAGIKERTIIRLILTMMVTAVLLGLWLVVQTNILLLLIGALCFAIGIFYTFGPIPISRTPLGEPVSGITMGFGIFFIAVFVNMPNSGLLQLGYEGHRFMLEGNFLALTSILFVSLPTVFLISNIMLANNTCDLEQDISNHRFTLPFYIGRKTAVQLFNGLMYACYGVIVVAVLLGLLHPILLAILLTLIPVKKNLAAYNQKQVKEETFAVALRNIVVFSSAEVLLMATSLLFI